MEQFTDQILALLQNIGLKTLALQKLGVTAHAKPDATLVSQVDLLVQCAIIHELQRLTPTVPILAEETPEVLHDNQVLLRQINGELASLGIDTDAIELLKQATHSKLKNRHWCLDPIDGTRGFLRGDHYAIALALINDDTTELGFLCCPQLLDKGVMITSNQSDVVAYCLTTQARLALNCRTLDSTPILIESFEMGPLHDDFTQKLKDALGWSTPSLRMDSQSKYGALILGHAHCYLRLPRHQGAIEYTWDHAAGAHLVAQAGGTVTDLDGQALDFSKGARLSNNRGVLATMKIDHEAVLKHVHRLQKFSV